MATNTASFDSITWSEFVNGVALNTNSYSSACSCFKEPVINLNSTFLTEENSGIVYDSKCGNRKCFAEYKEKYLAKSVRITQKELRRKSKQSYRRCRSYRPGIQHLYDTDTELVLKLCVKHARRSRPKLDRSHFEHPKRTVIYNQSNTDETADDSLVYSNNTITSVKIQQNRLGLILPILIVSSILMFAAFSVVFALLMRPSS